MGYDICGVRPTTERGAYWRDGSWYDIVTYLDYVAPHLMERCEYWCSNDGDGLNHLHSRILADFLQGEIDSGRLAKFVKEDAADLDIEEPDELQETVTSFLEFLRGCGGFEIW